jgi:hypothetical protein
VKHRFYFMLLLIACFQFSFALPVKRAHKASHFSQNFTPTPESGIVHNEDFSFAIQYPPDLLSQVPDNLAINQTILASKNDHVRIYAQGEYNPLKRTIKEEYQATLQELECENITYRRLGNKFFIISGFHGNWVFYLKKTLNNQEGEPIFLTFYMRFLTAEKPNWDPVLEKCVASFKTIPNMTILSENDLIQKCGDSCIGFINYSCESSVKPLVLNRDSKSVKICWKPVYGATSYKLNIKLDTKHGFKPVTVVDLSAAATETTFDGLDDDQAYFFDLQPVFRVSGINMWITANLSAKTLVLTPSVPTAKPSPTPQLPKSSNTMEDLSSYKVISSLAFNEDVDGFSGHLSYLVQQSEPYKHFVQFKDRFDMVKDQRVIYCEQTDDINDLSRGSVSIEKVKLIGSKETLLKVTKHLSPRWNYIKPSTEVSLLSIQNEKISDIKVIDIAYPFMQKSLNLYTGYDVYRWERSDWRFVSSDIPGNMDVLLWEYSTRSSSMHGPTFDFSTITYYTRYHYDGQRWLSYGRCEKGSPGNLEDSELDAGKFPDEFFFPKTADECKNFLPEKAGGD